jgi:uncharacterized protein (DUF488 family)
MVLYTIGHSTLTESDFLTLLRAHAIECLIDVRRFPGSRRHPHFSAEHLRQFLPREGIVYVHEPDLGGRREARRDSPNGGWRNAAFRGYADHMATRAFTEALERVLERAGERTTALMCAEAVPWRCHRQLIADALLARGHEVRHITSATRADPHTLSAHARVGPTGDVSYPGEPPAQQSLL